jgi:hypothetical protein
VRVAISMEPAHMSNDSVFLQSRSRSGGSEIFGVLDVAALQSGLAKILRRPSKIGPNLSGLAFIKRSA